MIIIVHSFIFVGFYFIDFVWLFANNLFFKIHVEERTPSVTKALENRSMPKIQEIKIWFSTKSFLSFFLAKSLKSEPGDMLVCNQVAKNSSYFRHLEDSWPKLEREHVDRTVAPRSVRGGRSWHETLVLTCWLIIWIHVVTYHKWIRYDGSGQFRPPGAVKSVQILNIAQAWLGLTTARYLSNYNLTYKTRKSTWDFAISLAMSNSSDVTSPITNAQIHFGYVTH